ncbi:MAG TPA: zinc ribbon domain-containing protein [Gemmataceae bacterium]|nr:zinc ribbon domain-containing protein [Gemmataceae bacterium]
MPTYEYVCDACGHNFDELQSFSDAPLTKCPACGKKKLRRLFGTGAAVLFKGSGFYETDYRSESYKSGEKADAEKAKPATSTDSKSDSNKTESKPKESTPAKPAKPAKSED